MIERDVTQPAFSVGDLVEVAEQCGACGAALRVRVDAISATGRPDCSYVDESGSAICRGGLTGCSVVRQWKAEKLFDNLTSARAAHDLFCICQSFCLHYPTR